MKYFSEKEELAIKYFSLAMQKCLADSGEKKYKVDKRFLNKYKQDERILFPLMQGALLRLITGLLNKFGVGEDDYRFEGVQSDCLIHLIGVIHTLYPMKSESSFSFFNVVARSFILGQLQQFKRKTKLADAEQFYEDNYDEII